MAIANFFQRMDMKNIPVSFGNLADIPSETQVKLVSEDSKITTVLNGQFGFSMTDFSLNGTISSLEMGASNVPQFKIFMTSNNDVKTIQSFIDAKNGLGFLSYILNGDDQITGSAADDIFGGFAGNDVFDGGAGNDVVFFNENYANYTITPTTTNVSVKHNATNEIDTLTNIEMLAFVDKTIPTPVYTATHSVPAPVTTTTPAPVVEEVVKPIITTPPVIKISKKPSAGDDQLTGTGKADKLDGLAGNDTLIGGNGADTLTGGAGKDVFKFNNVKESGITDKARDIITDFNSKDGDKIDLSGIDANAKVAKDQAFKFIGSDKFSADATAQVRFDAKTHILYASTDKDSAPEFSIQLTGVDELTVDALIL